MGKMHNSIVKARRTYLYCYALKDKIIINVISFTECYRIIKNVLVKSAQTSGP